jgi:hypothetical protein
MQQPGIAHKIIQQPIMSVLGLLLAGAVAKSGHGEWVAAGILAYIGGALAFDASRNVATRVAGAFRYQQVQHNMSAQGERR